MTNVYPAIRAGVLAAAGPAGSVIKAVGENGPSRWGPGSTKPPATPASSSAVMTPPSPTAPSTTAPAQSDGFSNQDITDLINGNMVPVLSAMAQHALEAWMAPPPTQADYPDEASFYQASQDYADGAGQRSDDVIKIIGQLNQAKKIGSGTFTLGDGTVITKEMINSSDPYVASQVRSAFENQSRSLFNGYNDLMNQAGLDQYKVDTDYTMAENDKRYKEFQASLDKHTANLNWDKANVDQSAQAVSRELQGMQESRARTDMVTSAMLQAAPWATTPGKTDYTGNDMGALISGLARQGGIGPDVPLIRFPTTVNIDPAGDMAARDQAMGVGQQPLPLIAGITTPNFNTAPPSLVGAPLPPTMGKPMQLIGPQVPQSVVGGNLRAAIAPAIAALQSAARQAGGGGAAPPMSDPTGGMAPPSAIPLISSEAIANMDPRLRALYGL